LRIDHESVHLSTGDDGQSGSSERREAATAQFLSWLLRLSVGIVGGNRMLTAVEKLDTRKVKGIG
jgi:hypothetical protein